MIIAMQSVFKSQPLKALVVAVVCSVSAFAADGPSNATPPGAATNAVVAVVNADPITSDQLASETVRRYGVDMVDNMVNRHLILQACAAAGIEVTNHDVSAEIHR